MGSAYPFPKLLLLLSLFSHVQLRENTQGVSELLKLREIFETAKKPWSSQSPLVLRVEVSIAPQQA